MELLYDLIVLVHLLGMAAIVGGYLAVRSRPRVIAPMLWGARTQIITGVVLAGLASGVDSLDKDPDGAKLAVKLVLAVVVVGCAEAWTGRSRRGGVDTSPTTLVHVVGVGAAVNAAVAALWLS